MAMLCMFNHDPYNLCILWFHSTRLGEATNGFRKNKTLLHRQKGFNIKPDWMVMATRYLPLTPCYSLHAPSVLPAHFVQCMRNLSQ